MLKYYAAFLLFLAMGVARAQYDPSRDLEELFGDVQTSGIFPDSKTFADAMPTKPVAEILENYHNEEGRTKEELAAFIHQYFIIPKRSGEQASAKAKPIEAHIDSLWNELVREDTSAAGSLIGLPHPYVVPGGRFNEIYYWDSYFTVLGLREAGREDLIGDMVKNFAWMTDSFGFIPNGARTYYLSRSQPPFFSLMVKLLAEIEGDTIYGRYLPQLQREYNFWMSGSEDLDAHHRASQRVVWLGKDVVLNRYWDNRAEPRPEAYKEDLATAAKSDRPSEVVYRNIRAACESGWDFSSRWLDDELSLHSIRTTEIIPVDLNSLLYHHEKVLAKAYRINGNLEKSSEYEERAGQRKAALMRYCWDSVAGFFMDYDFVKKEATPVHSMAGMYPLFFEMADSAKAKLAVEKAEVYFMQKGGVPATLRVTGQQWDAPNGWAPLQWVAYKSFKNYGYKEMAEELKSRWISTIREEYARTGKIMEKYNALYPAVEGGGGEYPSQDGFGWTNGVYLRMLSEED